MIGLPGSVKIKNNTLAPYLVEEMGGTVIAPGAEIDMLDEATPGHYGDYEAVHLLVTTMTTAKLRADIISGVISVTLDRPPR